MLGVLRYKRSLLLSLGLIASGVAYGTWLAPIVDSWFVERSRDAGFVLNDLELDGIVRANRSDVLAALDVDKGVPLLSIDLERIRAQLELLPWVKKAEVTRILPGKLKVKLKEREPFALWQENGQVRLIDETGHVITGRGLSNFAHLLMVVGHGAEAKASHLYALLEEFPTLAGRVKTAVHVGERRWDLIFDNGVRVKLPEAAPAAYDAEAAWQKFAALQTQYRLLEREVSVIDMRLPDRMILRVSPEGHRLMDGKGWAT
ncbi:cell division protein FtsQ/DivIB [Kordiimonas aestuarii]|uniref:cell division protein FtsQ/DivIB n=1 Tax=Kordiimonas aestuarii TaxID=1005925 RepID=UPI0021D1A37D|nr:cell division protein FtsQ/DivIB [Kordiimonas aestuarii]